jgi:3-dehydroquinate dehydratase / shikimate dehydrogenase
MICVSIAQESRRLALADMLNAAMLGADLVEVRLDRFEKDANLSELVAAKRTPVLFSCKRPEDGGQWEGPEDERLVLLRTAVISKADYVEIELDAADQIRPFPGCRRVVSYTNLGETPADIDGIYERILTKKPDVVKLTCRAETPAEAWPLIQILNKPPVPTVVVGVGGAGVLLTLLGRKIGAPWASAALERGMEAHPGQPTVHDLTDLYAYRDIGKKTRFVGITGTADRDRLAAGLINAACAHANLPHRVLPVRMGNRKLFRKIADAVRLQGVLLDDENYEGLHEFARLEESAVSPVLAADTLFPADDGWTAANTLGPAFVSALEATLAARGSPLQGRVVLLAGCGTATRMLAIPLKARGASLIWASKNRSAVQATSQAFGGRQLLWEAIYSTSHDVLVIGQDGTGSDDEEIPVHPGYLKPGMVAADATASEMTPILHEAAIRGCGIVRPASVLIEQVRGFVRRLGGEVPDEVLTAKLAGWRPDDV